MLPLSLWFIQTRVACSFGVVFSGRHWNRVGTGRYPSMIGLGKSRLKEQVINLVNQTIQTRLGKPMTFSLTIRYEVETPEKAILEVLNYDDSLQNLGNEFPR